MSDNDLERRFPRRFLLAGTGAAVGVAAAGAVSSPAAAASGSTSWVLGGNSGVTGSNFLGTKNVAPLIFKTTRTSGANPGERMRITPTGSVGIGVTQPAARLDVASANTLPTVQATNTNAATTSAAIVAGSPSGTGVRATGGTYGAQVSSDYCGVEGQGGSYGGILSSNGGTGAYGSGGSYGFYGSGGTCGVFGSGSTYGVQGSGGSYGVYGSGTINGVYGIAPTAVVGQGTSIGVFGTAAGSNSAGVRGNSNYVGLWGTGDTWGVYGITNVTTGQVYGVYGATDSPAGFGVWSDGNCHVTGTLSKAAGSFKIDHPLDPENEWLSHSFVESPDMMNIYNGNVTTDGAGHATVELPDYFHALNHDFRYQLTVLGEFAQAIVSRKIADGSFEISTDKPRVEVSWHVTGIRHDAYARAHPIEVVTPKTKAERGTLQFVPPGSKATQMRVGPRAAAVAR